ncbi:MAG: hypothetical protein Q8L69_13940 [Gallionellaceae bacterium]|nr:hypothetical protein [Gallionellaceae bacterium]
MSIMTMNMSGYEIEHNDVASERYGDEVLYAGWVPSLGLREAQPEQTGIPPMLAMADVDAFLRKMYASQR